MDANEKLAKILADLSQKSNSLANEPYAETYDERFESSMVASENSHAYKNNLLLIKTKKNERFKYSVQVVDPEAAPISIRCVNNSQVKFHRPRKLIKSSCSDGCSSENSLYTIDSLDHHWLSVVNTERKYFKLQLGHYSYLEQAFNVLEKALFLKLSSNLKDIECEALTFDEDACCDICQSAEGEDGNELVFCEGCLICVHQACYGIPNLPEGSWICNTCKFNLKTKPQCVLCPNTGGAMKLCNDGVNWCHVSCALWVPEVGFGDIDLMEPVTKLNAIPADRKRLSCVICKTKCGAPIQCCVAHCKIAFHVTCGIKRKLVMQQVLVDNNVKLNAYCIRHSFAKKGKHSKNEKIDNASETTDMSADSIENIPTPAPVSPEKNSLLTNIYQNFYSLPNKKTLLQEINKNIRNSFRPPIPPLSVDLFNYIYDYWSLKRATNFHYPLIDPPLEWLPTATDVPRIPVNDPSVESSGAANGEIVEHFKRIRISLDKTRQIIDMCVRREKIKRSLFSNRKKITNLQLDAFRRLMDSNDSDPAAYDFLARINKRKGSTSKKNHKLKEPTASTSQKNSIISPAKSAPLKESTPKIQFLTGNAIVDQIKPSSLVISSPMLARLRATLSKKEEPAKSAEETCLRKPLVVKNGVVSSHLNTSQKIVIKRIENGFPEPPAKRLKLQTLINFNEK